MATKLKKRTNLTRKLHTEALEPRAMMAADVMHNFLFPHDVDDDGSVTPLDALVVINQLNRGAEDSSSTEREFNDVDDDTQLTPLDALILINDLNSQTTTPTGVTQLVSQSSVVKSATSNVRVRVELETEGSETELKIRMDNAPFSSSFPVSLNDIALGQMMTDSRGRGELVLGQGDDNREHLSLPAGFASLSPDMELVIGDLVKGKLSQVAKVEDSSATTSTHAESTGKPDGTTSASPEVHLAAKFDVASGGIRFAEFEQETARGVTKRKFEAEIEKAAPNASFEVSVDGFVVGNIATDSKGKGKLRLTTNPKDAGEQLMPASFPLVADGTTVKIGAVQSTFRRIL